MTQTIILKIGNAFLNRLDYSMKKKKERNNHLISIYKITICFYLKANKGYKIFHCDKKNGYKEKKKGIFFCVHSLIN